VPKVDVDTFKSYYMHLRYLGYYSLSSWIRNLILIKVM